MNKDIIIMYVFVGWFVSIIPLAIVALIAEKVHGTGLLAASPLIAWFVFAITGLPLVNLWHHGSVWKE